MKLKEAINNADFIFTTIWMEAGASGFELAVSKEDAMEACSEFLDHEFDETDDAIYNKEDRAVAYIESDGSRGWILEIGSC